jgi:hypothetical protein
MINIPPEMLDQPNTKIAAHLGVSATAVLYARRRLKGLCERCGRKAITGVRHCAKHRREINKNNRKRAGHKQWKPGGRGRPPRTAREQVQQ